MATLKRLGLWLLASDERTWAGHALQGFLFCLVLGLWNVWFGVGFVFGAFLHREISDAIVHLVEKDKSLKAWAEDGWMDLVCPIIAMAPALVILQLLGRA